jgi:ribosomal protein S18 acetylase RimI-like enzyme
MASFIIQYNNKLVEIDKKMMKVEDREWFIRGYLKSFNFNHDVGEICVTINERLLISPENNKKKQDNLLKAAEKEFDDYIGKPKQGYKAIAAWLNSIPIGVLLYREMNSSGSIYFAQGFVMPEHQQNGVGNRLLFDLIKSLRKEFDLITRHAALTMCNRLGFSFNDSTGSVREVYQKSVSKKYCSFFKPSEPISPELIKFQESCEDFDENSKSWFIRELKRSYKLRYERKSFLIQKFGAPYLLDSKNLNVKDEWISNVAHSFAETFIDKQKVNENDKNKIVLVYYKQQKIGCLLYKILKQKQTVSIEEIFIIEEFQRQGIGMECLNKIFFEHFDIIRVNLRRNNDIEMKFFDKAGFIPIKTNYCNPLGLIEYEKKIKRKSVYYFPLKPKKLLILSSLAFVLVGCISFRGRMLRTFINFNFLFFK